MHTKPLKYILLFVLLAMACQGCKYPPTFISPSLDEQVRLKTDKMLADIQSFQSNAEKCNFMVDCTVALDDTAALYQAKILSLLRANVLQAYKAERAAYDAWKSYQGTVSFDVIGDVWQLYVGGSAGASYEYRHHYDITNINATEQQILYNALLKWSFSTPCHLNATLGQIDSAQIQMCSDIRHVYHLKRESREDYDCPIISHSPDQLKAVLKDLELFKNWMAAREALAPLLKKEVRELYESGTSYWIHTCMLAFQGYFIGR